MIAEIRVLDPAERTCFRRWMRFSVALVVGCLAFVTLARAAPPVAPTVPRVPIAKPLPPPPSGSASPAPIFHVDNGAAMSGQVGFDVLAQAGGKFKVLWRGDATHVAFSGTVSTTAVIDSVTPGCASSSCTLAKGDVVSPPVNANGGYSVHFDSKPGATTRGFEFTVTVESPSKPVLFDLSIDGKPASQLVFFSSGGVFAVPGANPFGLTTQ